MKAHEWGFPFDHMLIERIKKLVIPMWATIVQRRYDQTNKFPSALLMSVTCEELVQDTCDGLTMLRTKNKIPKPLVTRDKSDFLFVGERRHFKPYHRRTLHDMHLLEYNRFTCRDPFYVYLPDYIYIGNAPHQKILTLTYVPNDPTELLNLGKVEGDCFDGDDFLIDSSLLQGILSLIEEKRPKLLSPELDVEVDIEQQR